MSWLAEQLTGWWARERSQLFLFVPVMLAVGIGIYFALPVEPGLSVMMSAVFVVSVLSILAQRLSAGALAGTGANAACLIVLGLAVATLRTDLIDAPVLVAETGIVSIEGQLISVEEGGYSRRMVIAPEAIGRLDAEELPARVRLTWRGAGFDAAPGDAISIRGSLSPLPAPVAPGAYDYARQLYFERIGGVGYAVSAPKVTHRAAPGAGARVERLRIALARRIMTAVGPERPGVAAVCAALVTGKRDAVPAETEDALRDAGLAHLLAISGLHMGLFAGLFFFSLRFLLVQSEYLALHYPVKKWAAGAALVAATGYLVLSGAAWSTQRAYIMAAIFFVAIIADRRALSLRNVAIAASMILLLRPEALVQAGFQMSFAAVTVLIAAYEWWDRRRLGKPYDPLTNKKSDGWLARGWRYMTGLAATSILAGWATGPFAMHHFNRIAAFGLAGNLLAMPVMGAVIMPAAICGLLLMPLGLDGVAWQVMGWGVALVIDIAEMVSGWPGALVHVPQTSHAGFVTVIAGGLVLCLLRTPLRLAGLAVIAAGALLAAPARQPDIIIAPGAANVAFRHGEETVLLNRNRERFAAAVWLARSGQDDTLRAAVRLDEIAERGQGATCDDAGCVLTMAGLGPVAVSDGPAALAADCAMARLVIARYAVNEQRRAGCSARLIDTSWLSQHGTTAVMIGKGGDIRLTTNRQARGNRPWTAGGEW